MSGMRLSMRVWDIPTRLFHWLLVVLIATSYVSIQKNWMQIHFLSGYSILTLLLFRIAWGFVGSDTSRFGRFLKNPLEAVRHLLHFTRREPDNEVGHNAAGGWMVLVLLAVVAVQVGTGLFSNDDVLSQGPLAKFVSKDTSDQIAGYHSLNFNILLGVICLHVLAVLAYFAIKRHNLLRPMITGRKRMPAAMRAPKMVHPLLALVVFVVAAVVVWAFVNFV